MKTNKCETVQCEDNSELESDSCVSSKITKTVSSDDELISNDASIENCQINCASSTQFIPDEITINKLCNDEKITELISKITAVEDSGSRLQAMFEHKLAYDETKQQQIDSLHIELQQHRADLLEKTNRPLIKGLIRLHQDLAAKAESLKKKATDVLDINPFITPYAEFQEDIEILLDQYDIQPFVESEDIFNAKRQQGVKNVKTQEPLLVSKIAQRLKPGFIQGEKIIQKERVSVYVPDHDPKKPEAVALNKSTCTDTVEQSISLENENGK